MFGYATPPSGKKVPLIFLAGGITGCPDWQSEIIDTFHNIHNCRGIDMFLANPRRRDFPIGDPTAAKNQIKWEFDNLREADIILFWFPAETMCPIVLYELGAWSMTDKPIFVGVHPEYQRKQDVEIQTGLARPDVTVVYDIHDLAAQVGNFLASRI